MFKKILIANRGEIACRIIRTAKRLGIQCVAVYSEADANALHVRMADEAYLIGAAPSRDSYLDSAKILAVAKEAHAEAIHPGYGFLAENPDFAEKCAESGIIFIGPSAAAIRAMGSKINAKTIMRQADVPITPSYYGDLKDVAACYQAAEKVGYPLLIKAAAGGGGKGMRIVNNAQELEPALTSAKREAKSSFGDDQMLFEKYLPNCRHVEVQIFADEYGNCVYLFERDCSIQRRYQKIIEEAPAPNISATLRQQLGAAAIAAALAIHYTNAGTIEFLLAEDGQFYFMEMNTRLQVEHPITEMITRQDLVEWQLRIASGEKLPLTQQELHIHGHAFEARIYAEDPYNDFLPSTGKLVRLQTPKGQHVRIDSGFQAGDSVSVYYDPLLAKLITWGADRDTALQQLRHALADYQIVGVTTNIELLAAITENSDFADAKISTQFISQHPELLLGVNKKIPLEIFVIAALFILRTQEQQAQSDMLSNQDANSPWCIPDHWRLNITEHQQLYFRDQDKKLALAVLRVAGTNDFTLLLAEQHFHVQGELFSDGHLAGAINAVPFQAVLVPYRDELHVFSAGKHYVLYPNAIAASSRSDNALATHLIAPMPGTVTAVMVKSGQKVEQGEKLMVIEAMKMEHTIQAPAAATIKEIFFQPGDLVNEGAQLLEFS